MIEEVRRKLFRKGVSKSKIIAAFKAFDEDGSGSIDFDEMGKGLEQLGISMKKSRLLRVWHAMDQNGTGIRNDLGRVR